MIEHSAANVIIPALIASGLVSVPNTSGAWPVYLNFAPDQPDEIVTVYDTLGTMEGRIQKTGEVVEHPAVNIRVRSRTFAAGSLRAFRLKQAIDAIRTADVVVAGKSYQISSIQRTSDVLPLGQEEGTSRQLFTINGLVTYGEI